MHDRDYLHRDIKPENILLSSSNVAKLCDFGFCWKLKVEQEVLTDYVATWWYWSPELLITSKYNYAVDIWALGCVMYEMLTGDPLFPGDNLIDQISQIHNTMGSFPKSF